MFTKKYSFMDILLLITSSMVVVLYAVPISNQPTEKVTTKSHQVWTLSETSSEVILRLKK